jgi:flagellar biosynthesis protein FlhA
MLVIPLPSPVLDLLITLNITGSVLILLTALHVRRPLEFSVFPTLLLVSTVFRLALNVSATRLVLLHGYAGVVIQSFGHFVVGGSVVVGLVVFLILIIIQFVVITNGAGRVAEVAARFTLDAMPGKQMSVDADLSSGLINQEEARRRRAEVADEADFYGAMDGASKFVRGDAIAAIVIVAVNLIGGLAIGIVQRHLSASQAADTYSLLSVGDGLVSQIPALLLSLSTGIVVTRAAGDGDFALNVVGQLSRYRRVVRATSVVIVVLALIPGLPKIPFFIVGIALFIIGSRLPEEAKDDAPTNEPQPGLAPVLDTPAQLARETSIPELELELGMELIDLVDRARGGDLLERVKALRRNVARELGIVIPPVHARDNDRLELSHYAIRVHGVHVAEGAAPKDKLLAVGSGIEHLSGEATRDPAFGGPAKWIETHLRYRASVSGATVVERSAVIATHLSEVVRQHAGELLSRQDVRVLLDAVKSNHPVVLEEMAAGGVSLGALQGVLRRLLDEGIPVRDLVRIIEAITDQAQSAKDPDSLLEAARVALGPLIAEMHARDGRISAITLEPALEQALASQLQLGDRGRVLASSPDELESLISSLSSYASSAESANKRPVVVCSSRLRPALRRLIHARLPRLDVLGAAEIASQVVIENIGVVRRAEVATV